MKILLIEDEATLADTIQTYLIQDNYRCEVAPDFETAIEKVNLYQYDCILVDITLPDGNGLDVIRDLKKNQSQTGILVISARDSLDDKVSGLNLGADDYLTKPFHLQELNARIRSIIRRRDADGNSYLEYQDIRVIPDDKEVWVNEHLLDLTRKEYDILYYFISNPKRVISKEDIAERVWGDYMDTADSFDFVYSQIKNLRKKLNQYSQHIYLHAIYGMGYKFVKD